MNVKNDLVMQAKKYVLKLSSESRLAVKLNYTMPVQPLFGFKLQTYRNEILSLNLTAAC